MIGQSGFMRPQETAANAATGEGRAARAGKAEGDPAIGKGAKARENPAEDIAQDQAGAEGAEQPGAVFAALIAESETPIGGGETAAGEPSVRLRRLAAPVFAAGAEEAAEKKAPAPVDAVDASDLADDEAQPAIGMTEAKPLPPQPVVEDAPAKTPLETKEVKAMEAEAPLAKEQMLADDAGSPKTARDGAQREAPPQPATPALLATAEKIPAPKADEEFEVAPEERRGSEAPAASVERAAPQAPKPAPALAAMATTANAVDAAAFEQALGDELGVNAPSRGADPAGRLEIATLAPGQATEPRLAQQIAAQITVAASKADGDTIEIRLDPPELGKVKLSFTMGGDGVSAVVSVERPEAYDLMRRHADMLQRELNAAGYRNVSLDFAQSNDAGAGGRGDGEAPAHGRPAHAAGAEQQSVAAIWRGGPNDRLDIRL